MTTEEMATAIEVNAHNLIKLFGGCWAMTINLDACASCRPRSIG